MANEEQQSRSDEYDRIVALLVHCGVQPAVARLIAQWNTEPR